MKHNQGFSVLFILLAVVAVGAAGGIGWRVYNNTKNDDSATRPIDPADDFGLSLENQQRAVASTSKKGEPDAVASTWTQVTSADKGFQIRIPDGWKVTNYGQSDNIRGDNILYQPGKAAEVETIAYGYAGDSLVRFQVIQFKNTTRFSMLDGDETKSEFSSGTLKGTRYYKQQPLAEMNGIRPLPGEQTYTYEFQSASKTTYVIYRIYNYNQYSKEYLGTNLKQVDSDKNQQDIVERAVKTLVIF